MGSKYQEFTDDVVPMSNETSDDVRHHVPVDATSSSAAAAAADDIQQTSVKVSPSTQPVIIVQAPKLQRSFERYPSKAAVIFGGIQVLSRRVIHCRFVVFIARFCQQ